MMTTLEESIRTALFEVLANPDTDAAVDETVALWLADVTDALADVDRLEAALAAEREKSARLRDLAASVRQEPRDEEESMTTPSLESVYAQLAVFSVSRPGGLHGDWMPLRDAQRIAKELARAVYEEAAQYSGGEFDMFGDLSPRIDALRAALAEEPADGQ
jgi:hypothetical protein